MRKIGEGNGNPLQYSCLVNPMDGGAWWGTVHQVTKSRTRLRMHVCKERESTCDAHCAGFWASYFTSVNLSFFIERL